LKFYVTIIRAAGTPSQKVCYYRVGVLNERTLAAYCGATDIDMARAGETALTRVWTKIEKIRAKQALKNGLHTPLPTAPAPSQPPTAGVVEIIAEAILGAWNVGVWDDWGEAMSAMPSKQAKAALDALQAQGLRVVRAETLKRVYKELERGVAAGEWFCDTVPDGMLPQARKAVAAMKAALAALGDEG
jgi:hypothetical protein